MYVYVDEQKIEVDQLESIYAINMKFGEGIIRYKGRVLKKENNFAYYNITENAKLDFKGINGGISTFNYIVMWVIAIITTIIFLIVLDVGLITFIGEFILTTAKSLIMDAISVLPLCTGGMIKSSEVGGDKFKYVKMGLNLIFLVILGFSIYFSIYCYSSFVSLFIYYLSDGANKTKSVCKGSKSSDSVGFWTGIVYSIVYIICRAPMNFLNLLKNDTPDAVQAIINIPVSAAQTGIVAFKQNIWACIPYVGTAVKMYLTAIATMIEYLYSGVEALLNKVGDSANGYKFNCSDIVSLYGLFSFSSQLIGKKDGTPETDMAATILGKMGVKKYFEIFLGDLAYKLRLMVEKDNDKEKASKILTNDERLEKFVKRVESFSATVKDPDNFKKLKEIVRNDILTDKELFESANQYKNLLDKRCKGVLGKLLCIFDQVSLSKNIAFPIVCQVVQAMNDFGVLLKKTDSDSNDVVDMVYSGAVAGVLSSIAFIIAFIVNLIKLFF